MALTIPSPSFVVKWDCRRCGHTGGVAKTTLPLVDRTWTEGMMRPLLDSLRVKLVKVHQRQGCIASVEDFLVYRATEEDAQIVGLV